MGSEDGGAACRLMCGIACVVMKLIASRRISPAMLSACWGVLGRTSARAAEKVGVLAIVWFLWFSHALEVQSARANVGGSEAQGDLRLWRSLFRQPAQATQMAVALEVKNGLGAVRVGDDPRFGAAASGGIKSRVARPVAGSLNRAGHPMHPRHSIQKVAHPLEDTGACFQNIIIGKLATLHSLPEYPPRLGL